MTIPVYTATGTVTGEFVDVTSTDVALDFTLNNNDPNNPLIEISTDFGTAAPRRTWVPSVITLTRSATIQRCRATYTFSSFRTPLFEAGNNPDPDALDYTSRRFA